MAHQRSFRRNSELIHRGVANSSSHAGARTAPERAGVHRDLPSLRPTRIEISGKGGNRKKWLIRCPLGTLGIYWHSARRSKNAGLLHV